MPFENGSIKKENINFYLNELSKEIKKELREISNRTVLQNFETEYIGVLNERNVEYILEKLKKDHN